MDDSRPFLASGKFYVLWKRTYAISLYRYGVCIYAAVVGGKLRFIIVFFTIVFAF